MFVLPGLHAATFHYSTEIKKLQKICSIGTIMLAAKKNRNSKK
jgi:hypothetical protein